MMCEEIRIVKADSEILLQYEHDIENIMAFSNSVNFPDSKESFSKENRFTEMVKYVNENHAQVFVALNKNDFLGYVWLFKKSSERIHVNEIAVIPKAQKSGVGNKLLSCADEYARECNCHTIELFCMESNNAARGFYETRKYETEKRLLIKRL